MASRARSLSFTTPPNLSPQNQDVIFFRPESTPRRRNSETDIKFTVSFVNPLGHPWDSDADTTYNDEGAIEATQRLQNAVDGEDQVGEVKTGEEVKCLLSSPFELVERPRHAGIESDDEDAGRLDSSVTLADELCLANAESGAARVSEEEASAKTAESEAQETREKIQAEIQAELLKYVKLEWLGTSPAWIEQNVDDQQTEGLMDEIINIREAANKNRIHNPYYPELYICLARIDNKLGYCDIAAGNAYRAWVMVQCGLGQWMKNAYPYDLGINVREAVVKGLVEVSGKQIPFKHVPSLLHQKLKQMELNAHLEILAAMYGCAAFHEGCKWAKAAREVFPDEENLEAAELELKTAYLERIEALNDLPDIDKSEIAYMSRTGKIFQKPYPWMKKALFYRKPSLIDEINKQNEDQPWVIKPVVFGTPVETAKGDIGPLGVFAKRDISHGELVMLDRTIIGISSCPSSMMLHCDACHAALVEPYIHPSRIIKPECCIAVAYCSQGCYDKAMLTFHPLLCHKDFRWVYEHVSLDYMGKSGTNWRPILFLRLMAVVANDIKHTAGGKLMNPLKHSLVSRLGANYTTPDPSEAVGGILHDWQFWENVIAPTQILMELGVNIFKGDAYQQEVLQTIYWRFENNANQATTTLTGDPVYINAISPNYIFMNHSCDPNISWHGAIPDGDKDVCWLKDEEQRIMLPGSSAVWCCAGRDIKKGEELMISYVGDPQGGEGDHDTRQHKRTHLEKWFPNGCGCAQCEEENLKDAMK